MSTNKPTNINSWIREYYELEEIVLNTVRKEIKNKISDVTKKMDEEKTYGVSDLCTADQKVALDKVIELLNSYYDNYTNSDFRDIDFKNLELVIKIINSNDQMLQKIKSAWANTKTLKLIKLIIKKCLNEFDFSSIDNIYYICKERFPQIYKDKN